MLPTTVAAVATRYLALLDARVGDLLLGLYLVGSVALDDFREGRSDVDFVALLRRDIGATDIQSLRDIHDDLRNFPPSFDGIYVDAGRLAAPPATPSIVPHSLMGVFAVGAAFETNPAVWRCLAQSGIRVRGPEVTSLTIACDQRHLRDFLVANLQTYWRGWIAEGRAALASRPDFRHVQGDTLAWGVLGSARIACTLATGRIVSKRQAGRWALGTYSEAWHEAIRDACAAREGATSQLSTARFARALDFMDMLVADATRDSTAG